MSINLEIGKVYKGLFRNRLCERKIDTFYGGTVAFTDIAYPAYEQKVEKMSKASFEKWALRNDPSLDVEQNDPGLDMG